jgi:uncharacterized membrane protein affecting hemolysin expression
MVMMRRFKRTNSSAAAKFDQLSVEPFGGKTVPSGYVKIAMENDHL